MSSQQNALALDSDVGPLAPPRKAWVAFVFGLFAGPLSLVYVGRLRRAIAWFFATIALVIAGYSYMVYWAEGPIGVLFSVVVMILPHVALLFDAVLLAWRTKASPRKPYQKWWAYVLIALALWSWSTVFADAIPHYWVEAFYMPTRPMKPTILPGDRFLVDRLARRRWQPRYGEVVAHHIEEPGRPIHAKRIIGLPGDRIEIRDEKVFRNGEQIEEPYASFEGPVPEFPQLVNFGPHTVGEGQVFLLGDCRRLSRDSRIDGDYPLNDVIGLARVIFWSREYVETPPKEPWKDPNPKQEWGAVRWTRIGKRLDSD